MGVRQKARELAFQSLFQYDFCRERDAVVAFHASSDHPDTQAFAIQLVSGVLDHLPDINQTIQQHLKHWSPNRLSRVDRNILRLATYELLYLSNTPATVVLNEAIEIAKRYGSEDSGAFVNGVLDQIQKLKREFPALANTG